MPLTELDKLKQELAAEKAKYKALAEETRKLTNSIGEMGIIMGSVWNRKHGKARLDATLAAGRAHYDQSVASVREVTKIINGGAA